jgi:hypothetical protein
VFAFPVELALGLPLFASAASLLFNAINNTMALFIAIVFFQRLPISLEVFAVIFTLALFAPRAQSIFGTAPLAKLTSVFPLSASAASLLFNAINNTMALFIAIVFLQRFPISLVALAAIFTFALFAP